VAGVATVDIAGISGTARSTDETELRQSGYHSNINAAGISDFTLDMLIADTTNVGLRNYVLTTAIDVTGRASSNNGLWFATDAVDFALTSIRPLSTFSATLTPVPEPVSYGFLGAGMSLLGAIQYRRRERSIR
jgi:hypothetical protein